jgi:hypothetical protein
MDQREIHIKRTIEETRSAMGEKIDMIANRIHNTIIGPKIAADNLIENLREYKEAMQETTPITGNGANAIHQAVAETIERVKATITIIEQVKQDPWIMLAGAVLIGYAIGNLNRGDLFTLRHAHPEVRKSRELQPSIGSPALSPLSRAAASSVPYCDDPGR